MKITKLDKPGISGRQKESTPKSVLAEKVVQSKVEHSIPRDEAFKLELDRLKRECMMLSPRQVGEMIGVNPITLWRWEKQNNTFPKRTKLSERGRVGWRLVEIERWLNGRSVGKSKDPTVVVKGGQQ